MKRKKWMTAGLIDHRKISGRGGSRGTLALKEKPEE